MSQIDAAGVGYKMGNELTHMDIKTAADLRRISQEKLTQKFGERIGAFLYLACRGQVSFPVTMLDFTCLLNDSYNITHDDNDFHNITCIINSISTLADCSSARAHLPVSLTHHQLSLLVPLCAETNTILRQSVCLQLPYTELHLRTHGPCSYTWQVSSSG